MKRLWLADNFEPAYKDPKVKITGLKRIDSDVLANSSPSWDPSKINSKNYLEFLNKTNG